MTHALLAGVGLTHIRVYATSSPGQACGGAPHAHLATTELYLGLAGTGAVEVVDAHGHHQFPLGPGHAVQVTPGAVRRLVNHEGLEVLAVSENAAMEAEDSVFTFPDEDLLDALAYAGLCASGDITRVVRRRHRALAGLRHLLHAFGEHPDKGRQALERFHERAVAIVAPAARRWLAEWPDRAGVIDDLQLRVRELADRHVTHLMTGTAAALTPRDPGRLRARVDGWTWAYHGG